MKAGLRIRIGLATALGATALAAVYACSNGSTGGFTAFDGGVDVVYVDGGVRVVYVDGGVEIINADGGVRTIYVDGGVRYVEAGPSPWDAGPATCGASAGAAEALGPGMYGCAGAVTYDSRASLCSSTTVPCSALAYALRLRGTPTQDYWLDDALNVDTSAAGCFGSGSSGVGCGTNPTPMRVCAPTQPDPEGNHCNWTGCTLAGTPDSGAQYFGGCSGNETAGAVCCADDPDAGAPADAGVACTSTADGGAQEFGARMVGCTGATGWSGAASLCAAGYHLCSALEWDTLDPIAPAHDFWTADNLGYAGSGSNACSVSTSGGQACYDGTSTAPMHVCGAQGLDGEGNACAITGCGLDTAGGAWAIGGCFPDGGIVGTSATIDAGSYLTAGTVCCAP